MDELILQMTEDAFGGDDAQVSVLLDGNKVLTAPVTVAHASGQSQAISVKGVFGNGAHQVQVTFLNDAYGGAPGSDRNAYLQGATYNGRSVTEAETPMWNTGDTASFTIPAYAGDQLTLRLAEDAYQGDCICDVLMDGAKIDTLTVTSLHNTNAVQEVHLSGTWGQGAHTVQVVFTNDIFGGTAETDRNLYVLGASYNGTAIPAVATLLSTGDTCTIAIPATSAPTAAPPPPVTLDSLSGKLDKVMAAVGAHL